MTETEGSSGLGESPGVLREQALRRVRKRRAFRTNAIAYVVVNLVLWALWLIIGVTSQFRYPWPLWVTFGWGLGLVAHGWGVYLRRPASEDEIRREMDRAAHR
jgi:hypothetical protein